VQVYPAIDIKGGRVARVLEGEAPCEIVYGEDPVAQAREFVGQGATWLHVVDMDRAFGTGKENMDLIREIASLAGVKVQLGGNVNTADWVRDAMSAGVSRIVLGTSVALSHESMSRLVGEVGVERCALAVNTRDGRVALWGQHEGVEQAVEDLVDRAIEVGVRTVVYRDVERDGTVLGADVKGARRVASLGADVIVAGGVAGLDDVRAVSEAGLKGLIVGRALYEGRLALREAMRWSS
jgi:phosphoribosylformimino-5-aminoimidazole carboxamide ribotide isomerase